MEFIICDDETVFLQEIHEKISDYFQKKKLTVTLDFCSDGQELLNICKSRAIDAVFLDIDMSGINGFQAAKHVRLAYPKCILIFCSSHNEFVYDAFEYEPFWFLCKSNYEKKLEMVLDKVMERIKRYNQEFTFKVREKLIRIKYHDILYVEIEKHKIKIHAQEEVLEYRGNLSAIEKQLIEADFIKINSGCIVNLEWIYMIQNNEVILENKELLIISRSNKKNVKDAFFCYFSGK